MPCLKLRSQCVLIARIFFAVLVSMNAWAAMATGIWSGGGGGEIMGDAENPWFIQNTKKVKFCIRGDFDHFSLSHDEVSAKVNNVLWYWHRQFAASRFPVINDQPIKLVTQAFVEDECSGKLSDALSSHDLVIQLGELSVLQRQELGNPNRYIAVAVRTDYDPEQLKGKGFIYVSADSGPLKYGKENLVDKAWSVEQGLLLERVLMHEFGHIFGVQHGGPTTLTNLMSVGYPEFVLSREGSRQLIADPAVPDVTAFSGNYDLSAKMHYCSISAVVREFFSVPENLNCVFYKVNMFQMEVWAKKTLSEDPVKIGSVNFVNFPSSSGNEIVKIGITPAQKVFPNLSSAEYDVGYISAAFVFEGESQDEYRPTDPTGIKRQVLIRTKPNSLTVEGVLHGKIVKLVERGLE